MKTKHSNIRHGMARLQRQRGASLLEGIAYLGIAAIVILGAVSLLTSAFSNALTNRASEEVVSIRTGVIKLFMAQSANYGTADMTGLLISAGVFPNTLSQTPAVGQAAAAVVNAWNGAVIVTGANSQFTISYASVPENACINLLSGATGWAQIAVNGNAGIGVNGAQITPANAIAACTTNTNTIVWTSA
jgi:hypothetical protein